MPYLWDYWELAPDCWQVIPEVKLLYAAAAAAVVVVAAAAAAAAVVVDAAVEHDDDAAVDVAGLLTTRYRRFRRGCPSEMNDSTVFPFSLLISRPYFAEIVNCFFCFVFCLFVCVVFFSFRFGFVLVVFGHWKKLRFQLNLFV